MDMIHKQLLNLSVLITRNIAFIKTNKYDIRHKKMALRSVDTDLSVSEIILNMASFNNCAY